MTVWDRRDLPVLQALAVSEDERLRHGFLVVGEEGKNALAVDLSGGELHDAVLALMDANYVEGDVEYAFGPSGTFTHLRVTGRGQQALGQWPLFVQIASPETLALLLERLADEAPTNEEADNMRRAARYVRTLSGATLRALAVGVVSQLVRAGLGLG
jgi:hypothetical protein